MSARLPRVAPSSSTIEALGLVDFLAPVPREEIEVLAARSDRISYDAGERIFGELEPRETIIIVLTGRVRICVAAGEPSEQVLAEVGAGTPLGEVGLLTGRVASATAIATERTEALHLPREVVNDLMVRFPLAARAFSRILARRIQETDAALTRALTQETAAPETTLRRAEVVRRHGAWSLLVAAFRETLLEHRTELPFFFLTGFVLSLLVARITVWLGHFSREGLRDVYVVGLMLLLFTGGAAHFVFNRTARRILCAAYGAALGFLANELSVLLAFDVFYLNTTTRDESLERTYATLYRLAPTRYAVLLVAAIAIQATYMRGFYRRAAFIIGQKLRRRLRS